MSEQASDQGVYDREPESYEGAERFYDSGFHVVPWTEDMALRVAGVTGLSREEAVAGIRDAIDDDRLPEDAVYALIAAGWSELSD